MSKQQQITASSYRAVFLLLGLFAISVLGQAQPPGAKPAAPPPAAPAQATRPVSGDTRQQAYLRFLEARRLKAEAYRLRGDKQLVEQALKAYRDTIWLDPQAAEPRVDLGELYFFFKNDFTGA